jgi:hypothetical protein
MPSPALRAETASKPQGDTMAKRQLTKKTPIVKRTRPAGDDVVDSIAVYVGRTLGELVNRKDDLQKQLAQVEQQIAAVSGKVGAEIGKYLPSGIPGLSRGRKTPVKRPARKTAPPLHPHGRDPESGEARQAMKAAPVSARTRTAVRQRSAPRGTRRG